MAQPQAHSARLTQPVLAVGQRGRLGLQGADREQLQLSRRGRRAGKCSLQFERQYQSRKKLVGSGEGGSWAPGASESHQTPVIALPRLSPLWDAVRPATTPGPLTTPLAFFSAPTLPRPTRLRPQGKAGSFLAKAQPLSSWVLPGWASASSSSSSGSANLIRLKSPGAKVGHLVRTHRPVAD